MRVVVQIPVKCGACTVAKLSDSAIPRTLAHQAM